MSKEYETEGNISNDGMLLIGNQPNFAQLYRKVDGIFQVNATLLHGDSMEGSAFINDDNHIVTWDKNKTKFWDVSKGEQLTDINVRYGHVLVSVSPDKQLFATRNEATSEVIIWDSERLTMVSEFTYKFTGSSQVTFSPDSLSILVWSSTGNITVWNHQTGLVNNLVVGEDSLRDVAFSTDSLSILAWKDSRIWTWRLGNSAPIIDGVTLGEHISSANFSDKFNILLTWSRRDKKIYIRPFDERLQLPMMLNYYYGGSYLYSQFTEQGDQLILFGGNKSNIEGLDISWLTKGRDRESLIKRLCENKISSRGLKLIDNNGSQVFNENGEPIKIGSQFLGRFDVASLPSLKRYRGTNVCD